MEKIYQKLASIKAVEPDSALYDDIITKIQTQREIVSIAWIRAAAAVMFLLFSAEFIALKNEYKQESSSQVETLIPSSNNRVFMY